MMTKRKYYYFDYASTTPVDRRVLKKMLPYFSDDFGNPSNLYELGRTARSAFEDATRKISNFLGCVPAEFIYTGSATESDNLALFGVARANKDKGNKIIVSNVEHKGIISAANALIKEGIEIVELKVDEYGMTDPKHLAKIIDDKTILISITYSDSETGTIQPIKEISEVIKTYRKSNNTSFPYLHTDASQAMAYMDLNVNNLGVDLMTLSGHKVYGPKGIGGLYVRRGTNIKSIIFGGGQQGKLRSGTENIPGIVGFGEAVEIAAKERKKESERLTKLRDKLQKGILGKISKVVLNGHPAKRLPNFCNVSILDIEGEALLLYLDEKGIIVNTGSACNSQSLEPSYILAAMGNPYEYIHGSLRFTLGRNTTLSSINYILKELPPIVEKLRKISPLNLNVNEKKSIAMPEAFVGNQAPHFIKKQDKLKR